MLWKHNWVYHSVHSVAVVVECRLSHTGCWLSRYSASCGQAPHLYSCLHVHVETLPVVFNSFFNLNENLHIIVTWFCHLSLKLKLKRYHPTQKAATFSISSSAFLVHGQFFGGRVLSELRQVIGLLHCQNKESRGEPHPAPRGGGPRARDRNQGARKAQVQVFIIVRTVGCVS